MSPNQSTIQGQTTTDKKFRVLWFRCADHRPRLLSCSADRAHRFLYVTGPLQHFPLIYLVKPFLRPPP